MLAAILVYVLLAMPACAEPPLAVGSKKFTESYILAEIAKTLLEKAGFEVAHRPGMGGTVILWQALLHGDIALYPEYTGTIADEILKTPEMKDLNRLRNALAEHGIGMTGDLGFNDSYALVMRKTRAAELGITTISDLKRHPSLRAGPTPEFMGREDGWEPLLRRFGLKFDSVRGIEHGLGYSALLSGQIDVKDCYTTDAKIGELDLVALKDDLHFFPQYKAVFLYRLDTPAKAVTAIKALEGKIGEEQMIELNRVAEETKDYAAGAAAFFEGPTKLAAKPGGRARSFLAAIPRLTAQHLTIVGISLLAAIIFSIPLGIAASAGGLLSEFILGVVGIIQTIPSLALLALMIPVFGIGQTPAIVALFLYSLLPIVRGTATGLQLIPASLREASAALGLTPASRLWLVDLPIASPSILAGIKTSAVINVGTATLAGLIGGGGYGEPIQSGLQLNDNATILQGAIPAALLALLVQAAFSVVDRLAVPKGLRLGNKKAG